MLLLHDVIHRYTSSGCVSLPRVLYLKDGLLHQVRTHIKPQQHVAISMSSGVRGLKAALALQCMHASLMCCHMHRSRSPRCASSGWAQAGIWSQAHS